MLNLVVTQQQKYKQLFVIKIYDTGVINRSEFS